MSRPCPCTSKVPYDRCCGPFIAGTKVPESAELLMRSRFSAYALGKVDYLIETTAEAERGALDREDLATYCRNIRCVALKIIARTAGGPGDETGTVKFHASLQVNGKRQLHVELSRFVREEGRWRYLDGDTN
ncbi:MAG: YchJ family protein [Holophagaceae bacterium]|nr:YchJ family protein [Holophagaceae bacterium]